MLELEPLLTFKEVMAYLRISRPTLQRWLKADKIPAHKVGNGWRFVQSDVQALVMDSPEKPEQGEPDA